MIKNMISTSERRIYEDLDRKMKNESLMKDFIEEKVNMVKEQLSSEHKMALIAETKFIKETKSSLESLFSFINSVKKQLSEELSETQKLSLKSIQSKNQIIQEFQWQWIFLDPSQQINTNNCSIQTNKLPVS